MGVLYCKIYFKRIICCQYSQILARDSGVHGEIDEAENVAETKKYTEILTFIGRIYIDSLE